MRSLGRIIVDGAILYRKFVKLPQWRANEDWRDIHGLARRFKGSVVTASMAAVSLSKTAEVVRDGAVQAAKTGQFALVH